GRHRRGGAGAVSYHRVLTLFFYGRTAGNFCSPPILLFPFLIFYAILVVTYSSKGGVLMKSSRLLSLLLAVCLLFSLSSCSERGNTGQQDPTPAETESSAADNAAPQEDTATDAPADQQSAGEAESAGQQQTAP